MSWNSNVGTSTGAADQRGTGEAFDGTTDLAFFAIEMSFREVVRRLRFIHANPWLLIDVANSHQDRRDGVHYGKYVNEEGVQKAEARKPAYGLLSFKEFRKAYSADLALFESHLKYRAQQNGSLVLQRRQEIVSAFDDQYRGEFGIQEINDLAQFAAEMLVMTQGIPLPLTVEMEEDFAVELAIAELENHDNPITLPPEDNPQTALDVSAYVVEREYTETVVYSDGDLIGGGMPKPQVVRTPVPRWEGDGTWLKEWAFFGLSPFTDREYAITNILGHSGEFEQHRERLLMPHPVLLMFRHYENSAESGYYVANSLRMKNRVDRHFRLLRLILKIIADLNQANARFANEFVNNKSATIDWEKHKPLFETAGLQYCEGENDPLLGAIKAVSDGFSKWRAIDYIELSLAFAGLVVLFMLPFGVTIAPTYLAIMSALGVSSAIYRALEAQTKFHERSAHIYFEDIDPALKIVEQSDDRRMTSFLLALELVSLVPITKVAKAIWKPIKGGVDKLADAGTRVVKAIDPPRLPDVSLPADIRKGATKAIEETADFAPAGARGSADPRGNLDKGIPDAKPVKAGARAATKPEVLPTEKITDAANYLRALREQKQAQRQSARQAADEATDLSQPKPTRFKNPEDDAELRDLFRRAEKAEWDELFNNGKKSPVEIEAPTPTKVAITDSDRGLASPVKFSKPFRSKDKLYLADVARLLGRSKLKRWKDVLISELQDLVNLGKISGKQYVNGVYKIRARKEYLNLEKVSALLGGKTIKGWQDVTLGELRNLMFDGKILPSQFSRTLRGSSKSARIEFIELIENALGSDLVMVRAADDRIWFVPKKVAMDGSRYHMGHIGTAHKKLISEAHDSMTVTEFREMSWSLTIPEDAAANSLKRDKLTTFDSYD